MVSIPVTAARHRGVDDDRRPRREDLTMKRFVLLAGYGERPLWDDLTPEEQ